MRVALNTESSPRQQRASVTVLERSADGQRTVTEWVGYVEQFRQTVRWTEEDVWDDDAHTCRFHQTKGDYSKYSGEWRFVPIPSGTRFESRLEFEYNIPLIGPLIQGIIARLMKVNLENTLSAIAGQAEGGGSRATAPSPVAPAGE
ncbi:MAG: SRPBCC family protein [Chloroflexi bacterium]|nr:SRPBCC family protein [Chloroflexota bacterium]